MANCWLVAGVRTPFAKAGTVLSSYDAITLSMPVVKAMAGQLAGGASPDFVAWGSVIPNLGWSNIAREIWLEAGLAPQVPAYSLVLACASSMTAAFSAAGMLKPGVRDLALIGGVESMSRVQLGLTQNRSDDLRSLFEAGSARQRAAAFLRLFTFRPWLYIPRIANRVTGLSMGEHMEITAKEWNIARQAQDDWALRSHKNTIAAQQRGFFDDLIEPLGDLRKDMIPRADTSLEKLAKLSPSFDRKSGRGTLTAGNSSPLTDGAAALWVASDEGLDRLPAHPPRAKLIDYEICAVDFHSEGLLMAPSYAIPRLLLRHGLRYADIALWEIHEAFAAQVLANIVALESKIFLQDKLALAHDFGPFPWERVNPNGGSVAIGHPFAATGARDLSQAIKELWALPSGSHAVISICADGGQGGVALIQRD
jgi:acetyl-CoA C-acetyltransferase